MTTSVNIRTLLHSVHDVVVLRRFRDTGREEIVYTVPVGMEIGHAAVWRGTELVIREIDPDAPSTEA